MFTKGEGTRMRTSLLFSKDRSGGGGGGGKGIGIEGGQLHSRLLECKLLPSLVANQHFRATDTKVF